MPVIPAGKKTYDELVQNPMRESSYQVPTNQMGVIKGMFSEEGRQAYMVLLKRIYFPDKQKFLKASTQEVLNAIARGDLLEPEPKNNPLILLIFISLNAPEDEQQNISNALNQLLKDVKDQFGEKEMEDIKALIKFLLKLAVEELPFEDTLRASRESILTLLDL